MRAQNQVALVALCELIDAKPPANQKPPQIILCTTHLKATKNIVGERTRLLEVQQLLGSVQRLYSAREKGGGGDEPLILITGDLNAAPDDRSTGFEALAYSAVKASPLGLRSVLNDDVQEQILRQQQQRDALQPQQKKEQELEEEIWTTWKARRKKGKESIAKSCIDYILYRPPFAPLLPPVGVGDRLGSGMRSGLRAKASLGLFTENEIGEDLLPSARYPSDHLAISADLEVVVWPRPAK